MKNSAEILTVILTWMAASVWIAGAAQEHHKVAAGQAADIVSGEDLIVDAVQKYENGDFQEAADLLDKILSDDKDNDAAFYYRGLCGIRMKDAEAAEKNLKQAVAIDSANFWYRYMLAGLYGMTGRKILTIDMYESLLRDFPKKSELYYSLANLYLNTGQSEKALKTIGDIETQFGKSDATVMTRFDILWQQNRGEEAYRILEEYNREYSSPQVLSMLGEYEMSMYNDSSALAYYNEALAIDRDYAPARLGKAETYRLTRKYPEYFSSIRQLVSDRNVQAGTKADYLSAIIRQTDPKFVKSFSTQFDSTFSIAVNTHPGDSSIMQTAGLYYYATEQTEKAADTFRAISQTYPDSQNAAADYIQTLLYMKEWEQAATASDSAFSKFGDPGFLELANIGEYNRKNYQGVISNCEKMIRTAPADSAVTLTAWSTIGDMHHLAGDQAKAFKAYDNALKINPNYAPVLNNYAYYLSLSGKQLKKAYNMSKKTVEAEPDNATYLDTFGWILYLQGKSIEAKPFFKHAMLYGGKDSATILNHYAAVLEDLGETDLAKVYRQQAKNKAAEGQE